MKHIVKRPDELPELIVWKRDNITNPAEPPEWEDLEASVRTAIKNELFAEQGHLCCYCGRRIVGGDSHIEHLEPRESCRAKTFSFDNLLASCQANIQKKDPRHCGVAKESWYDPSLMVSPLDPGCEARFRYDSDGHVHPASTPDEGATQTIFKLDLDGARLVNLRKGAIDGLIDGLSDLTPQECEKLLQDYRSRDAEGRYKTFCFVLAAVVQSLYMS